MRFQLKNSLAKQLFLFSIGIILALMAAFIITNHYVKSSIKKNTLVMNDKMLGQIEGRLESYKEKISDINMVLVYSPTTVIYYEQSEIERIKSTADMETVFSNTMLLDENIVGIYLYDMNMNRIASAGKEIEEDMIQNEIKTQMEFGNIIYLNQMRVPYYLVYCPVFDLESRQYEKQIGMSVLLMKTDELSAFLTDSEVTENAMVYLLDDNNKIIAATENETEEYIQEDEKQYLTTQANVAMRNWHVVSMIPRKELTGSGERERGFIAGAYGIAAVLILLLAYFCYTNFVRRINRVDRFIKNIVYDGESRMQEERMDEIGRVVHNLNQMLDDKEKMNREIQESQKRMYEIELAKKQLQVLAYRNQINPHFLYNTFECIRGMALYHDMDDIAEITMALSKVFRFAVKEDNIVTVQDEINYIKEYATIIDYRFMGKIEVSIDVDEELYSKKVIKLMLQPLVENAVFHGLEQKIEDGEVRVTVCREWDHYIKFFVEDNGCGIEEQKLESIRETLDSRMSRKGIGLANIYQRLKLFYGDDMIFEIKSKQGEGTRIIIVVPDHVEDTYAEGIYS